jgi:hypothetical protein
MEDLSVGNLREVVAKRVPLHCIPRMMGRVNSFAAHTACFWYVEGFMYGSVQLWLQPLLQELYHPVKPGIGGTGYDIVSGEV